MGRGIEQEVNREKFKLNREIDFLIMDLNVNKENEMNYRKPIILVLSMIKEDIEKIKLDLESGEIEKAKNRLGLLSESLDD